MRGYQRPIPRVDVGLGSIPADAGLPAVLLHRLQGCEVYPRGCGATDDRMRAPVMSLGLSPRMRGYREHMEAQHALEGSIPADAGLPYSLVRFMPMPVVYPRGCGATRHVCPQGRVALGLSPRMRGYRPMQQWFGPGLGSIPADAGLPSKAASESPSPKVYPRGCGATRMRSTEQTAETGLSPRMRGYPGSGLSATSCCRSIPADAGLPS